MVQSPLRQSVLAAIALAGMCCGGGTTSASDSLFDGTGTTVPATDPNQAVIIDHRQAYANAALIPDSALSEARSLEVLFGHQSVGQNILDGLAALENHSPSRYKLNLQAYPTFKAGGCISQFPVGSNGNPSSKISDFQSKVNSGSAQGVQVALFKFCFVDFTDSTDVSSLLQSYQTTMSALESGHPSVKFVYCTVPITTTYMATRAQFNAQLRSYCEANGKALFDIASIEAYDPSDKPVGGSQPTLYAGYAQGDGAHLNSTGSIRLARAWWWLMARLAGWNET